jgi:hypothetical protein
MYDIIIKNVFIIIIGGGRQDDKERIVFFDYNWFVFTDHLTSDRSRRSGRETAGKNRRVPLRFLCRVWDPGPDSIPGT